MNTAAPPTEIYLDIAYHNSTTPLSNRKRNNPKKNTSTPSSVMPQTKKRKQEFTSLHSPVFTTGGSRQITIPVDTLVIFYDFETTGLNPFSAEIIECAFLMKTERNHSDYSSFINHQKPLQDIIKTITKITEQQLVNAPSLQSVVSGLVQRVGSFENIRRIIWVAHNNYNFDQMFWNKYFRNSFKDTYENVHLDSLRLAQYLYPEMYSFKLTSIASYLSIHKQGDAHRALYDTELLSSIMTVLSTQLLHRQNFNLYEFPNECDNILHNNV